MTTVLWILGIAIVAALIFRHCINFGDFWGGNWP